MVRSKIIPFVIGVVLLMCSSFVFAQTQQQPPPRGGGPPERDPRMEQYINRMFQDMDTNHDGKISKSEWMSFYENRFRKIDKNGHGYITKDDVRSDMMEMQRPPRQQ